MNTLVRSFLLLILLLNSGVAYSACWASLNNRIINVNISTINASNELPLGSPLTDEITVDSPAFNYSCDGSGGGAVSTRYTRAVNTQTSYVYVYATEVQGIGLKVEWTAGNFFPDRLASCQSECGIPQDKLKVTFIKTGNITSGVIYAGELARVDVTDGRESSRLNVFILNFPVDIIVEMKSCIAMMPVQSIDLGSYILNDLKTGTKQGDFVDLPIKINCPVASKVFIKFEGTIPFGQRNIIANGLNDGAKGVGVKIFRKNKIIAVPIGTETGINGTVPKSFSGVYTEELKAQLFVYDRLALTAGKINAFAVFTLRVN